MCGVAGSAFRSEGLVFGRRGLSILNTTGALPNTEGDADAEVTGFLFPPVKTGYSTSCGH